MNRTICTATMATLVLMVGCRQPANQTVPLSPISPLGGPTRVPPPATGSYAKPGSYYQGQASIDSATTSSSIAEFSPTVGSGVAHNGNWDGTANSADSVSPASYVTEASPTTTRPQLNGMKVVDLSDYSGPQPTSSPTLQPIRESGGNAPSTAPSTARATTPATGLSWRSPYQ